MANITELQLQGDSTVYKLNDARITTTAVPTATHFLATDSSISSIAPITAANLASVLGGLNKFECLSGNLSDINREGLWIVHYDIDHNNATDFPSPYGDVVFFQATIDGVIYCEMFAFSNDNFCYHRRGWAGTWGSWKEISTDIPSFYKNYNSLAELKAALDAL